MRKSTTKNVLARLYAFGANVFFCGFPRQADPQNSKHRPLMAMLNLNHIPHVNVTPKTSKPHPIFTCVERVG
jgi:hypothetical protein